MKLCRLLDSMNNPFESLSEISVNDFRSVLSVRRSEEPWKKSFFSSFERKGVPKTVVAQCLGGIFFSIFGGQPLIVVMTTAPLTIYVKGFLLPIKISRNRTNLSFSDSRRLWIVSIRFPGHLRLGRALEFVFPYSLFVFRPVENYEMVDEVGKVSSNRKIERIFCLHSDRPRRSSLCSSRSRLLSTPELISSRVNKTFRFSSMKKIVSPSKIFLKIIRRKIAKIKINSGKKNVKTKRFQSDWRKEFWQVGRVEEKISMFDLKMFFSIQNVALEIRVFFIFYFRSAPFG